MTPVESNAYHELARYFDYVLAGESIDDKTVIALADRLSRIDATESRVDAGIALYLAGHYSRSKLVLPESAQLMNAPIQRWLVDFMTGEYASLTTSCQTTADDSAYTDEAIAECLSKGGFQTPLQLDEELEGRAVAMIVQRTVSPTLLQFLRYLHEGDEALWEMTNEGLRAIEKLALRAKELALYWRVRACRCLVTEFHNNSLWVHLQPLLKQDTSTGLTHNYIKKCVSRNLPILWRSQLDAVRAVLDPERKSFVLSLETGAGKTHVAEIAILQFMQDFGNRPGAKCIYIVPLRSLAKQKEDELQIAFQLEGVNPNLVSSLYGSREIDPLEREFLETARVLVVTPEKLDGLIRQDAGLLKNIRLVIADEGHEIGDDPEVSQWLQDSRSWKYRAVLERLISALKTAAPRLERDGARVILMSGVMSNAADLAEWLAGDRSAYIKSSWRPFDLPKILEVIWRGGESLFIDGSEVLLDLGKKTQTQVSWLDTSNDEQPAGPKKHEALATFAKSRAKELGSNEQIMIYCASRRQLDGNDFLSALSSCFSETLPWNDQQVVVVPNGGQKQQKLAGLLRRGVAVHHGQLQRDFRDTIERSIFAGDARVVFATETLIQGMNFRVPRLIIYELYRRADGPPIPVHLFWNMLGRVGRILNGSTAISEPTVWCFVDETVPRNADRARKALRLYEDNRSKLNVINRFLTIAKKLRDQWLEVDSNSNFEGLLMKIAQGDFSFVAEEDRSKSEDWLRSLDNHVNDLEREANLLVRDSTSDIADDTDDFVNALMRILTGASVLDHEDHQFMRLLLLSRMKTIRETPEARRRREYLLGLAATDCKAVLDKQSDLLQLFKSCEALFRLEIGAGAQALFDIMQFAFTLKSARHTNSEPLALTEQDDVSDQLLLFDDAPQDTVHPALNWIRGDESIPDKQTLEPFLDGTLAWLLSAMLRSTRDYAVESGVKLSADLEYLPSFIKYGTPYKSACWLMRMGISREGSNKLAAEVSHLPTLLEDDVGCVHVVASPDLNRGVVKQLILQLDDSQIASCSLDENDSKIIAALRASSEN